MKKSILLLAGVLAASLCQAQGLQLNDLDYFERQGVNVLVFSNSFNGGFNDEKDSGIEIIQSWRSHRTRWGHQTQQRPRAVGLGAHTHRPQGR